MFMVTWLLLVASGIAIAIVIISFPKRKLIGATSLIFFALSLLIWILAGIIHAETEVQDTPLLKATLYFCSSFTPTSLFVFILEYTNQKKWLHWTRLLILGVEPLLIQVLFWAGIWSGPIDGYVFRDRVNAIYSDLLLLTAIFLIVWAIRHIRRVPQASFSLLLAGTLLPLVPRIVFLVSPTLGVVQDLLPVLFTISGLLFVVVACNQTSAEKSVSTTRDVAIEGMNEGWMILDTKDRIIDINPAAEILIGIGRVDILGQSAEKFLDNWKDLINRLGNAQEMEVQGSVEIHGKWCYISTRISLLKDGQGKKIGYLIIWRDNTQRREMEDARQRARDEMFILLNSISGAASRAQNMEEFLNSSMYQIVFSFNCQSGAIYLADEKFDRSTNRKLLLSARHNLSDETIKQLNLLWEEPELMAVAFENAEPFLIPDTKTNRRGAELVKLTDQGHLLIVPMNTDENIVGVICLLRNDDVVFKAEEVTRLTVLAREVATFIYSERQRFLAISLTERQRVVRDLHDSVTQKLYGLVTLIEAAQAGLEAGTVISVQVLSRIGENARQALREMRLFLHQLHPIDLEREGLVGALHQRLAAVEGRSDIKARMLTDENISLSLDVEVALYFIAQEALNNVLKHAHAKSVNIRIRKRKNDLVLEVEDDGRGFNPQQDNLGGIGLRNMKERIIMVGGKLRIDSHPGEGTKIIVTVPKEKRSKAH